MAVNASPLLQAAEWDEHVVDCDLRGWGLVGCAGRWGVDGQARTRVCVRA